jgi:signal transduction histidine kinase
MGLAKAAAAEAMTTGSGIPADVRDDALDRVPAFIVAFDIAGKIVRWNRHLEDVTGFLQQEMVGRDARELIEERGDRRLDLKGGGHRLVRWQVGAAAESAKVRYAVGIDVTDERDELRKTMQSERLSSAATLVAGLAHGVRNPLNSAALQLQVLRRRVESGKLERAQLLPVIDIVHAEIQRLEQLVHDFLAFAQPRRVELESTSLNGLLRELSELVAADARKAGVTIEHAFDQHLGPVELEPLAIREALLHLMRNALEAMPNGGTLTLRSVPADTQGFVRVEVEDTGVGFTDATPLFHAFYSTKPGGSGLGLAIAQKVASEHGGALRAEPQRHGARFSLLLPQLRKDA